MCTTEHLRQQGWKDRKRHFSSALPITPKDSLCQQGCEEGGAFQWGLSNASEAWEREHRWPQDPMWTESNWPPGGIPELQLYQVCISSTRGLSVCL